MPSTRVQAGDAPMGSPAKGSPVPAFKFVVDTSRAFGCFGHVYRGYYQREFPNKDGLDLCTRDGHTDGAPKDRQEWDRDGIPTKGDERHTFVHLWRVMPHMTVGETVIANEPDNYGGRSNPNIPVVAQHIFHTAGVKYSWESLYAS